MAIPASGLLLKNKPEPGHRGGLRENLRLRLLALGVGGILIVSFALVVIALSLSSSYAALSRSEVDKLIFQDLSHITSGVYNLVKTESEAFTDDLERSLRVVRGMLDKAGGYGFSTEKTTWKAVNQFNGDTFEVTLPKLLVGGTWRGIATGESASDHFVDETAQILGISVTVFQRMNEAGDMLRVATTVRSHSGENAAGTFIPAVMPDGTGNPVIERLFKTGQYSGRAMVVGNWYLTGYEALRDQNGSIVGMLYVGQRQAVIESRIRKAIVDTVIGRTGYVFVISGKGADRGSYVVSRHGQRDGENLWSVLDDSGYYPIRDIVTEALTLMPGEQKTVRYQWLNPGESRPQWKIARLAYFAPWDWVIGASAYEDELDIYRNVLREGRTHMAEAMIAAGLTVALLFGALTWLLAKSISAPLRALANAASSYSRGTPGEVSGISWDTFREPVQAGGFNEITTLASAFSSMTARIQDMVQGLRLSEEKLRGIYENSPEGIFRTNAEGEVLDANPALAGMLGYRDPDALIAAADDISGRFYTRKEDRDELIADLRKSGTSVGREILFRRLDGSTIWVLLNAWALRHDDGALYGIAGFVTDIDQRKRSEATLHATLEQKDTLLREVHHRVKNNLQILVSLLGLEADRSTNPGQLAILAEFASRIRAMSQIHELVYHSEDLNHVDMLEYTRLIAGSLYQTCRPCFGAVDYFVEGDSLPLDLDQAIPCGLLISEILSNSFRHAFAGDKLARGTVRARITVKNGRAELDLSDDGSGMSADIGPSSGGRLGMTLIPVLAEQIGAELSLDRSSGTRYTVRFAVA